MYLMAALPQTSWGGGGLLLSIHRMEKCVKEPHHNGVWKGMFSYFNYRGVWKEVQVTSCSYGSLFVLECYKSQDRITEVN